MALSPGPAISPPASSGLLRLITCGSVDDGKSTLIGRLLHDTRSIHRDQLEAVKRTSLARGDQEADLALLTDGLRAEREQGITIDVAYRYFATLKRKFILADTPGHVQYTRNMVTGASTADAAIILVDARQGVVEQTRRHACLAVLLDITQLIVCVNKMDLIGFDRERFEQIRRDFMAFAASARPDGGGSIAERARTHCIPISALKGDNVVAPSNQTPWYTGGTLLDWLESVPDRPSLEASFARFPVQTVIRPQSAAHRDYRGYAGQMASGRFQVGDEIAVLPGPDGDSDAALRSRIRRIHIGPQDVQTCFAPQSVAILLEHDIDISRGDLFVRASDLSNTKVAPVVSREIEATIIWMATQPLSPARRVLIKHASRTLPATVSALHHKLDMQTLGIDTAVTQLGLNEIGRTSFRLSAPIASDPYTRCRATGGFIVIDEQSNNTVGAGLIR